MILQNQLHFIPGDATELSPQLSMIKQDNNITFFTGTTPIYNCQKNDKAGIKIAAAVLARRIAIAIPVIPQRIDKG